MKTKIFTVIMLLATLLLSNGQVQAENRGVNGMVLGAGSGALIGQAIGRDTEATLVGTAVGGFLGYIIGNEMDKSGHTIYAPAPMQSRPVYRDKGYHGRHDGSSTPKKQIKRHASMAIEKCREAEVLATINGRPKKLLTTVCRDGHGNWVMPQEDRRVVVEKITLYKEGFAHEHHGRTTSVYRGARR